MHGEALLVLPTKDLEDVALELVPNVLTINLRRKPLVVQRTQLLVVVDIDELLATRGGVGNIELPQQAHKRAGSASRTHRARGCGADSSRRQHLAKR